MRALCLIAAGTGDRSRIYQTTDGGATWTALAAQSYWAVAFASPRAGWAVGPEGRISHISLF